MDTLAHGLWSNIIVYKKYPQKPKHRFIAVLFGVLPDLLVFTPLFIYGFLNRMEFRQLAVSGHWTVKYAPWAYNYTHSLVIFFVVLVIVWAIRKEFYWPMLAWGFHIFLDLFTHPNFYQTPFLFPISDYKISWGISWSHPVIMLPQYIFFVAWYIWWYFKARYKSVNQNINGTN